MAAQIPIKDDPAANEAAFAKVRADKLREVKAGHDGTWVAHPGMVALAKEVFDEHMPSANQIAEGRGQRAEVKAADLLRLPEGVVTEKGLRQNINVGILYLSAWLGGSGAVPLYNLMEDAATAEISRTQLWQWIHHRAKLDDGRVIDAELYQHIRDEELAVIGTSDRVTRAAKIFDRLILAGELADFLTLPAYDELLQLEQE
jgi:malate synthase